jgi:Tol biopolymer transport system component
LWPRWSPDGKRLRFTVEDSATASSALWEVRADGLGAHLLLPGWNKPSVECCGEWSRDGRYYVFQTGTFAHSDIWAVAEGFFGMSRPIQLTAGPLSFSSPSPSLDGKWLYAVGTQNRYETVRLDPLSGQITTLTSMPSLESLDYSRDGKWLAYVSYPDGILWRSRADGSDRLQLTYPPTMAAAPQWSPDGTQIAFTRIRVGEPLQIDVVPAEGGTPQSVFPEARNQSSPAWSGDGQSLIFSRLPWMESGRDLPVWLEKVDLHSHKLLEIVGRKTCSHLRSRRTANFCLRCTLLRPNNSRYTISAARNGATYVPQLPDTVPLGPAIPAPFILSLARESFSVTAPRLGNWNP